MGGSGWHRRELPARSAQVTHNAAPVCGNLLPRCPLRNEMGGSLSFSVAQPFGAAASPGWARQRIALTYLYGHGRLPDLQDPRRFTELVQMRKLYGRNPAMTALSDKLAVKQRVGLQLGNEWCVPTLWHGGSVPALPQIETSGFAKSRHGCNQTLRIGGTGDWERLCRLAPRWSAKPYGKWLDEWAYRDVPRGVLIEPLLGDGCSALTDYKIYVFGGRATHVQVHLERGKRHRWVLHDRDWNKLVLAQPDSPRRPSSLGAMLEAAEDLARDFSFARVDFYEVSGKPLFGEFSFYPGSGLDPFAADWIDFELGSLWRGALGR